MSPWRKVKATPDHGQPSSLPPPHDEWPRLGPGGKGSRSWIGKRRHVIRSEWWSVSGGAAAEVPLPASRIAPRPTIQPTNHSDPRILDPADHPEPALDARRQEERGGPDHAVEVHL